MPPAPVSASVETGADPALRLPVCCGRTCSKMERISRTDICQTGADDSRLGTIQDAFRGKGSFCSWSSEFSVSSGRTAPLSTMTRYIISAITSRVVSVLPQCCEPRQRDCACLDRRFCTQAPTSHRPLQGLPAHPCRKHGPGWLYTGPYPAFPSGLNVPVAVPVITPSL